MNFRLRWILLLALGCRSVLAEPRDPPTAEALFRAGRDAVARGAESAACAAFEASYALDPADGTLLNLARCEEELHHFARAWAHYRQLRETLSGTDGRLAVVKARLAVMEPRMAWLRLTVPDKVSVTVLRDQVAVPQPSLGLSIPVDPGEHRIAVMSPGRSERKYLLTLREGQRAVLSLRSGDPIPATLSRRSAPRSIRADPTAAYLFLGGAAGAVLVAGATAIFLLQERSVISGHCPTEHTCDDAGLRAAGSAQTLQTATWVAGGIGVATATAGIVLLQIRSGKERGGSTAVSISPLGASASVAF